MADTFSPYHPLIFAGVLFSLPVFYFIGGFFTPRLHYPLRNIAARCVMGVLVFTVLNAIIHAGLHTMLLPFGLLLPFLFKVKPEGLISDLKTIPVKHWVFSGLAIVGLLLLEMSFTDIRNGKDIIIGNWDYATSGGLGHDLYITGSESLRSIFHFKENRTFYHYGDLWLSGFYSYYLGILPYYSYILVYRVLAEILLMLLLFSWARPLLPGKIWLAVLLPFFVLQVSGLQSLPIIGSLQKSQGLIELTETLGNCIPYLMTAAILLLFSMIIGEGFLFIGLVGLMLASALHPALMLIAPVTIIFLMVIKLISKYVGRLGNEVPLSFAQLTVVLVAALSAYIYASLDGRMYPVQNKMLSAAFIFEALFTLRYVLAYSVFLMPFLWGVWLLLNRTTTRFLFWLHVGLYLGMAVSFSMVFTLMRGNTEQILIIYITALLIPVGSIGLFTEVASSGWRRIMTVVAIAACLLSAANRFTGITGNNFEHSFVEYTLGFDDEWKSKSRLSAAEAISMRNKLSGKGLTDVGIAVDNHVSNKYTETIYLSHRPYLRAFIPGAEFHRVNLIPRDTFEKANDMHRAQFFKRSTLNYCYEHSGQSSDITVCMCNEINPSCFLLDTTDAALYIPDALAKQYNHYDTLGRFILVSRP